MASLIDALLELKQKLLLINPDLKVNDSGLNNTTDSKMNFVISALLPSELLPDGYQYPGQTNYPDYVVQAIWNLVDACSKATDVLSIVRLFAQKERLVQSLRYLDEKTWVPRIVDSKTYAAGQAFSNFLTHAIADNDFIGLIPSEKIKTSIRDYFKASKKNLAQQIQLYEVHSLEQIEQVKALNKEKNTRIKLLKPRLEALSLQVESITYDITDKSNKLNTDLKSTQFEEFSQYLEQLKQINIKLLQEKEDVNQFIELWHTENQDADYHLSGTSSDFIKEFLNEENSNHEHLLGLWKNLFNQSSYKLYQENLADVLEQYYQRAKERLGQLNLDIDNQITLTQNFVPLFEERIEAIKLLEQFEKQLEAEIQSISERKILKSPTFLSKPVRDWGALSVASEPELRINENKALYIRLTNELELFKEEVINYQKSLQKLEHNIKHGKNVSAAFQQQFAQVINAAKNKLNEKLHPVNQQIRAIEGQINRGKEQIAYWDNEMHKLSHAGREKELASLEKGYHDATEHLDELRHKYSTEHEQLQKELSERSRAIEKKYDEQTSAQSKELDSLRKTLVDELPKIKKIEEDVKKRKKFLSNAKEKLALFKAELLKDTSIYIPANKVPQKHLLKYLELDPKSTKVGYINELYETQEKGNKWYGLNIGNLTNHVSHYLSVMTPQSEFIESINEVIGYIDLKIEQVEKESVVNYKNEQGYGAAPPDLSDNNLYRFRTQYQPYLKMNKKIESLNQQQEQVKKDKIDELDGIERQSALLHKKILKEKNLLSLEELVSAEAQIRLSCATLEFQWIEKKEYLNDLVTTKHEKTIADFDNTIQLIEQIPLLLSQSAAGVDALLLEQKKKLDALDAIELEAELLPLLQEHHAIYQDLIIKKNILMSDISTASQLIAEKKLILEQLYCKNMLAAFEKNTMNLIQRTETIADGLSPERSALTEEINAFKKQYDDFILKMGNASDSFVEEKKRINEHTDHLNKYLSKKLFYLPVTLFASKAVPLSSKRNITCMFDDDMKRLISDYYGERPTSRLAGWFGVYLSERKATYWLSDLFRQFAAFTFSSFGYITPEKKRENFLMSRLYSAICAYQKDPEACFNALTGTINEGKKLFSPRAPDGEDGYDKSLHALLSKLETDVAVLELNRKKPETFATDYQI